MWRWLQTRPSFSSYFGIIAIAVLGMLCYVAAYSFARTGAVWSPQVPAPYKDLPPLKVLGLMSEGIAYEEGMRLFPLFALLQFRVFRESAAVVATVALSVSVVFGLVHLLVPGTTVVTVLTVQGVFGVVLTVTYLKCGGVRGGILGPLAGIVASYAVHWLYNTALLAPELLGLL